MADAQLAPIGDNGPPLRDTAKMAIEDQLAPLKPRLTELLESLGKAKCDDEDGAGKCADLAKLFKKLKQRVDSVRQDVKEPYSEAAAAVQAGAKGWFDQIDAADRKLRDMIGAFQEQQRQAAAKAAREQRQREAEEAARIEAQRREEAAKAAERGYDIVEEDFLPPEPAPAKKAAPAAPIATGDYGAKASSSVRKVPQIVDVYALPISVLGAPKVTEAILSVVRAMRSGNPDLVIKGIEIVDDHSVVIR